MWIKIHFRLKTTRKKSQITGEKYERKERREEYTSTNLIKGIHC